MTTSTPFLRRRSIRFLAAAAVAAALACSDAPAVAPTHPPMPPGARIGSLVGTVDDATGTVTFTPLAASANSYGATDPAIYGNQNVTISVHSTSFSIDSVTTPGTKVWSIGVGLRNLLAYPIGSNQNATPPADSTGIYVFFSTLPIVTLPSGCGCTVTVTNGMGTAAFTSPTPQPYFWYRNRLKKAGTAGGLDTTINNPVWKFTGQSTVHAFTFVVLISSAWPPPFQTQWVVSYNGTTDSLIDTQAEPRWPLDGFTGGGSEAWSPSGLALTAAAGTDVYPIRNDSLSATGSAIFDAALKVSNANNGVPESFFGFFVPKVYLVGVAQDKVGFLTLTGPPYIWVFTGPTYTFPAANGTALHSYRLRKFAGDSVVLCVDGARVLGATAASLGGSGVVGAIEAFGTAGQSGSAAATWTFASYTIGSAGSGCS
jgi:hypothetical protein